MIPDRIIEQGTLTTTGTRAAVDVRIPWYRALPASCIAGATLSIDGVPAPAETLRWELNGKERTFDDMKDDTEEWWFPLDSAVLSGDIPVAADDSEHEVAVDLTVFIPYIVIGDDEVLHIEEHDTKTMKAVTA
ncbi:DUF6379 domain-containing protein [uncultured Leifsonia sp.]|uniref:C-glycoside deglycosidase beta subunit domain-containing protein n=1 Tax=uncultured Leifsonia sp. TaxID=340359 RepID=UPI0025DAC87D|nr:DUF6379 domain-containing protein [uncultured Leifsonia sp.]